MVKCFSLKVFNPTEEEINFDSFVKLPLLCFKFVFFKFKPLAVNPNFREKLQHFASLNSIRLVLCALILAVISLTIYTVLNAGDFLSTSTNVLNVFSTLQITLTTCILYEHRTDIMEIFEDLRASFEVHRAENAKYKIGQYLDGFHLFFKIYASIFVLLLVPITIPTFNYLIFGKMEPEVNFWFPFDPFTDKTFPIVLFWINFVDYIGLVVKLGADSLAYALITVVAMEFDILKADFMDIKLISKHQRIDKLKTLIDRHNKLLDIGDKLQSIYGLTFFVIFTISSLLLCFSVFVLSATSDLSIISFYVPYFFMVSGQILLMCVYGQKILDSSSDVAEGIYECSWEELGDHAFNKQLLLIILRAQRPKQLSGLGFFDVTLSGFRSVSCYSTVQ